MAHLHSDGATTRGFVQTEAGQWLRVWLGHDLRSEDSPRERGVRRSTELKIEEVTCLQCGWRPDEL